MRVLFALAVLAVASAVTVEQTSSRLAAAARSSPLGQNVLSELTSKMNAGAPIDDLRAIIEEIRGRLTAAQGADAAQDVAHQKQCDNDKAELEAEITRLTNQLESLGNQETNTVNQISETQSQIVNKANQIQTDAQDILDTNQRLVDAEAQFNDDKELYNNRSRDTAAVERAIEQIETELGGELDSLEAGQGMEAKDFAGALLQVASQTHDDTARSMVELAAAATQALGANDVTRLRALFEQLKEELRAYQGELNTAMAQSQKDYEALKSAELGILASQQNSKTVHESEKTQLTARLGKENDHLEAIRSEIQATSTDKSQSINVLQATTTECANLHTSYEARSSERSAEQDTLDEIEAIIEEKLGTGRTSGADEIINGQ